MPGNFKILRQEKEKIGYGIDIFRKDRDGIVDHSVNSDGEYTLLFGV